MFSTFLDYYVKHNKPETNKYLNFFFSNKHNIQFFKSLGDQDMFICLHCSVKLIIPNGNPKDIIINRRVINYEE